MNGRIESIFIAPAAKAPLVAVAEAVAIAARGLEGDRYAVEAGSFSRWPGSGRHLTFIEAEAVEAVLSETGIDVGNGRHRRNLVTRDVRLDDLIGRRFRIGGVLLRGERQCQPCEFLERLTEPGVLEALKGRGGLRAEILEGGAIRAGDAIDPL